jgi:hypothetical protein
LAIVKQVGMRRLVEKSGRYTATRYKSYLEKGEQKEMPDRDTMDVAEYVDYLQKGCPDGAHYESCSHNWAEDFQLSARSWNKLSNNVAVEYVQ